MRKTRRKKITGRRKIIIVIAALAMFICTITVFYIILGNYSGLGLDKTPEENPYDMSCLSEQDGLKHYDDGTYESVAGIDVSTYQKDIDWEKVKADGIDFAMIRVGYRGYKDGSLVLDDRYKEYLKGAKQAGLDVGIYFFSQARTAEEAIKEARFVIRHIRGRGINYPVVFDMEPIAGADRITDLTAKQKTEIADAFCRVIERNGYTPMIYGNLEWLYGDIELGYLTDYDIWLAHYADTTDFAYEYKMWQYTHRGSVKGVKGHVDLNLYFIEK